MSPHKMHLSMANMLSTERMRNEKESFVRTVLTARQQSKEFSSTIRQKDEYALKGSKKIALDQTDNSTANASKGHISGSTSQ